MLARFSRLATVRAVGASVRGVSSKALVFDSYGSPSSVLRLAQTELGEPAANQVLVKMLAAPINPADLNAIEGTYGTSTTLPTVAGSEGVGVVEQVGSGVKSLKVGDRVIPAVPSFGTWRTYALANENQLTTVASDIPIEYAATISVNPATAYRLLADFADLKEGDVIIQNGATSTVGQSVIQLARLRGVKTINVIRSESYDAETVETLKKLGGDIVVTEQYLRTPEFKRLTSDLPAPKLAINSIGGRSATDIARTLEDGGKLVTIGGMSKRPVQIPTSLFIFRNISLHGFWLSKWAETHSTSERKEMIDTLCTLVKRQDLSYGIERHKFSTYEKPLAIVASGARHPKLLFQLDL